MAKCPAEMAQSIIRNLEEKTGATLDDSGSFNAMVSHRVRVASTAEVDDELLGWLRDAYERA